MTFLIFNQGCDFLNPTALLSAIRLKSIVIAAALGDKGIEKFSALSLQCRNLIRAVMDEKSQSSLLLNFICFNSK